MNNKTNLNDKLQSLPNQPGCYLYYNKLNQVIYVGKAKNLKNRVSSYFHKVHNLKTSRLVNEIVALDTIVTKTEKEALILEHNLIKKYHPKYNILLNDDKNYPYIVITNERNPRYEYVRSLKNNYQRSYGPFPDGSYAREIIKLLEQVYPLRRCKGNLHKPCLYYYLGQCSGACFKNVSEKYYQEQIDNIDSFFKGNTENVKNILLNRMQQLSKTLQFEQAEKIKKLLLKLDWSLAEQTVELSDFINIDILGIYYADDLLIVSTLFYRLGKLSYKDSQAFYVSQNDDQNEIVRLYLQSLYEKNILPTKIVIDNKVKISEIKLLFNNAAYPKNNEESQIIKLAEENSLEVWKQEKQKIFAQESLNEILLSLQELLKLPTIPYLIQAVDIANLGDSFITAGFVTYKQGKPSFNDYRKYNITQNLHDDPSRIAQAVSKHFQKIILNNLALPDLLIIDGAEQQVKAAQASLAVLKLKVPVIGLVKNEKHRTEYILLSDFTKIKLAKNLKLFLFLSKIQEDVHNFTINSFRRRQNKSLLSSILLQVKGLGDQKIKLLHENFTSLQAMKEADFDTLNQIISNRQTTKSLQEFLKKI